MTTRLHRLMATGPLLSRIVAALCGGYVLAALTSVATLALPMTPSEAVFTGMVSSILVYAAAVIWVFAAATARRAWLGLMAAGVPLLLGAGSVWH